MRAILKRGPHAYERIVTTREDAVARFAGEGETYKVEIAEALPAGEQVTFYEQDGFVDLCRGPHLQTTKPIKRVQAHLARRRLLARRLERPDADAHLRHGLLRPGRPRRAPRAHRGGAPARPPPARPRARPLPSQRHLAGVAVLAPARDGAVQRARAVLARAQREPRLRGGQDADPLRHRPLEALRALGQLPRQDVPDRAGRGPAVRPQADELPRATSRSTTTSATPTATCRCGWPSRASCIATRTRARCTGSCACATSRRTTRTSSAAGIRSRTRSSAASTSRASSTRRSAWTSAPSSRRAPRSASAARRSGIAWRPRSPRRSRRPAGTTP